MTRANKGRISLGSVILLGIALGAGFIFACQTPTETGDTQSLAMKEVGQTTIISSTEVVWDMLGQVNQDRALNDLRQLAGETPICADSGCYTITNRLTGSEGLQWAMDHIYEDMVSLSTWKISLCKLGF